MTPAQKLNHYRTYMRAYGFLLMLLANRDNEILKLMTEDNPGPFMTALRELIENSPNHED